jgi:outer membrane receptor for ferrienterochelin and colicins
MKLRLTPIAMAIILLSLSAPVLAQQSDGNIAAPVKAPEVTAKPAAEKIEIQKVEIKGSTQDYDPRRDDTASKTVLNHEEIMKYGDTNVFDVLKRAPGVTVIGNSIRMRGLGGGYTQILVNGERPPPGFSMDALAPDQIEKIEVIRAATAEHSMQAIAGTINIVLTKVVSKRQRDLRLSAGHAGAQNNAMLIGTLADRAGQLSYFLNVMLSRNDDTSPSSSSEIFAAPQGEVIQSRETASLVNSRSRSLGLQPRLTWKLNDDDQLHVGGFLQSQRGQFDYVAAVTNRAGNFPAPDYVDRQNRNNNRSNFFGANINWVAKIGGGKLDAKWNMSNGESNSAARSLSRTADRMTNLQRDTDSLNDFTNYGSTGKYSRTLFDSHSLAAGWEASMQATEQRVLRVEGLTTAVPVRIVESFDPRVTKLAAYAQDEWNITKNWSMYQGIRWEGIRTESAGSGLLTTESRNHVLSPVAQTLYKFPDKSGRQLRMALTRTYKAPNPGQLSARRFEAELNTRFNPDSSGNPNLRPELAHGLDLTYEHFWFPGAVFSVGGSVRKITDYIRSRLTQDARGHWLVQPLNDGTAQVRTLDIELKFPLKALMKDAPAVDFRANVNRNWSKVESVPGPDNRLDQQVPLSAVVGVDYRADKLNAGASFAFRQGGTVRISEQQTARMQRHRDLEAYLLYKFKPALQLRVAVSNALGEDYRGDSRYDDAFGSSQTLSNSPRSARFQANLEMKF